MTRLDLANGRPRGPRIAFSVIELAALPQGCRLAPSFVDSRPIDFVIVVPAARSDASKSGFFLPECRSLVPASVARPSECRFVVARSLAFLRQSAVPGRECILSRRRPCIPSSDILSLRRANGFLAPKRHIREHAVDTPGPG